MEIQLIRNILFTGCLFLAAFHDLKERKVPNRLIGTMIFLWISERILSILFLKVHFTGPARGLLCGLALFAPVFLISFLFRILSGKQGIGNGDLKLFFASGLYLDSGMILFVLFLSCLFGLLFFFLFGNDKKKDRTIPFAPAIAFSVFLVMNRGM